jgi:hypothetical protein
MSMKISLRSLVSIAAMALLAGCQTAMQLHDANQQLTSSYYTMVQATDNPAMRETAIASLRDLGKASAASAAKTKDPLNKISFYRVAATAAWQAGDVAVLEYADAGSKICEKHWSGAPRDCGMLTFIDDMAAVDETTTEFNQATKSGSATAQQAEEIFKKYEASAQNMIANHGTLATRVPADLLNAYGERIDDLVCTFIGTNANGLVTTAGGDVNAKCRFGNLRFSAQEADIKLSKCPASGVPTAVQDC